MNISQPTAEVEIVVEATDRPVEAMPSQLIGTVGSFPEPPKVFGPLPDDEPPVTPGLLTSGAR